LNYKGLRSLCLFSLQALASYFPFCVLQLLCRSS